jgi:hypothetical protein
MDEGDTRAGIKIARVEAYDEASDAITGYFCPWYTEGDPFVKVLRATVFISYDNGSTWEQVGWVETGPEIVRRRRADPDAVRPVIPKTSASWGVRPQVGRTARLLRFSMDVRRDMDTEVELDSK